MNHWQLCALDIWHLLRWFTPFGASIAFVLLWEYEHESSPNFVIGAAILIYIYIAAIAGWWL